MKKAFKIFFTFILFGLVLLLIFANSKLYYRPKVEHNINRDIENQLHFLKKALNNGADTDMQSIYPEGYIFINALYGLTWFDLAKNADATTKKIAIAEIAYTLLKMQSDEAKSTFTQDLAIPYGTFYTGWTNLLLAKKLLLTPLAERQEEDMALYKSNCEFIAQALENPHTPYPKTYTDAAWPADVMISVASLALYEHIFDSKYISVIQHWTNNIKTRLDPATGLIPHAVNTDNGKSSAGARGSSQSLMLPFLLDIDSTFAKSQFALYKKHFLTARLGLPGLREYTITDQTFGDIDSGPVIWGIGGAASIVGVRTMTAFKEYETAIGLRNSIEMFGCPSTSDAEKKYLRGYIPMADAFIAWTNANTITKEQENTCGSWRSKFQLYSALAVLILSGMILFTWRKIALK